MRRRSPSPKPPKRDVVWGSGTPPWARLPPSTSSGDSSVQDTTSGRYVQVPPPVIPPPVIPAVAVASHSAQAAPMPVSSLASPISSTTAVFATTVPVVGTAVPAANQAAQTDGNAAASLPTVPLLSSPDPLGNVGQGAQSRRTRQILEQFGQESQPEEARGREVNDIIARAINYLLTRRAADHFVSDLMRPWRAPANITYMRPVELNHHISRVIDGTTKRVDASLARTHNTLIKSMVPMCKIANWFVENDDEDQADMLKDMLQGLRLMAITASRILYARRDNVRSHIPKKYEVLTADRHPITTMLFGDDLQQDWERIDHQDFLSTLTGQDTGHLSQRGRGSGSRGRGRGQSHPSGGNQPQQQQQQQAASQPPAGRGRGHVDYRSPQRDDQRDRKDDKKEGKRSRTY